MRAASLAALERMGMTTGSMNSFEGGELIYASSDYRTIEIEVEPISAKATRIAQTERLLDSSARGATAGSF